MLSTETLPPRPSPKLSEAQPPPSVIVCHPEITATRVARLSQYMDHNVLHENRVPNEDRMCCAHKTACKGSIPQPKGDEKRDRFYEGQLSHVGRNYDLTIDADPVRIVVVGQEYGLWAEDGGKPVRENVSLAERYEMIRHESGDCAYRKRNPHMRGTTSALRLLLGNGIGSDAPGELVKDSDDDEFHVFDAFALVNVLLCSAGATNKSEGRSTAVMRKNCLAHFTATMEILEPTILVLQGIGVQTWLKPVINPALKRVSSSAPTGHVSLAEVAGVPTVVCGLTHPSAHGKLGWGNLTSRHLLNVVKPALKEASDLSRPTAATRPTSQDQRGQDQRGVLS